MPYRLRAMVCLGFLMPGFFNWNGLRGEELPADCPPGGTSLRWESFALPFFTTYCNTCHPWNDYTTVYVSRGAILSLVSSNIMPPFDPVPEPEQKLLEEWIACGLPFEEPKCSDQGTQVTYTGFAADFFAQHCGSCHSKFLSGEERQGAPEDQNWDDYASVVKYMTSIRDSVLRNEMPPGGLGPWPEVNLLVQWIACGAPDLLFRRADANDDGIQDISDAIRILAYLFAGTATMGCLDAADTDASGDLDISDAVFFLQHLFLDGPPPPPPFEECAYRSQMGCQDSTSCPK